MRCRLPLVMALVALPVPGLSAQTADQARLVFSVGLGQTTGGGQVWSVGKQPFQRDTFAISRAFRPSFNVSFGATYFPGNNLGFNAEAFLLGLGTRDGCTIVAAVQPLAWDTRQGCRSLNSKERGTASGALSLGVVYRVLSRAAIYPYVRANLGMVVSQESFLGAVVTIPDSLNRQPPADQFIYIDDSPANIQPYLSFGGGVVTALSRGFQMRFEVRDNWVRVPVVTGPTSGSPAFTPPTSTQGRHVLSFQFVFDIILERKRGRRY